MRRLPQDSNGNPWNGDYVHASGDLVEDLTHNFFLETGARNNKLKVYEMCDHPAARALTGYLLCRGGVHQIAYARALEHLTGVEMMKRSQAPGSRPTRSRSASRISSAANIASSIDSRSSDYLELAAVFNGPHPETGEELEVVNEAPEGVPPMDLPSQPDVFAPDYAPEEIAEIAAKLRTEAGMSEQPSGVVANNGGGDAEGVIDKVKDAVS